jgi:hypothetical protein
MFTITDPIAPGASARVLTDGPTDGLEEEPGQGCVLHAVTKMPPR